MSGDDKSMEEILREIREIVAEDEKDSRKNPEAGEDMSPSEILKEIREIVAEDGAAEAESSKAQARPRKRDIRLRRKAMLASIGGAITGAALVLPVLLTAGVDVPMSPLQIAVGVSLFSMPLAIKARPENGWHVAILMGAALAMPVAASSAFGLVLYQAPPAAELAPIERLVVPLLASIAALAAGLAGWLAVRWATRNSSLWKRTEVEDGDARRAGG